MNMRFTVIVLGLAAILVLAIARSPVSWAADKAGDAKDELTIENYDFEWIVAKTGDVQLTVEKTQDSTVIRLRERMDSLSFVPKDAAERCGGRRCGIGKGR
jgi:hypothetical protein